MSKSPLPKWPADTNDREALSSLADWIDDNIAAEYEDWLNDPDEFPALRRELDDGEAITPDEKTLLISAFQEHREGRWRAVAAHLKGGNPSRKFVKLVGLLLENNAFAPNNKFEDRSEQRFHFIDATKTKRVARLLSSDDLMLIDRMLHREFGKNVGEIPEERYGRITAILAAMLRGIDTDDEARREANKSAIQIMRKRQRSNSFLLGELVDWIRYQQKEK